jgi:ATP phosphoribosyltransferase regulatory subunit
MLPVQDRQHYFRHYTRNRMAEQMTIQITHAHIPYGVADYFWEEAYARRQLEAALLELFRCWGYGDVIPPMFEFADTYQARASAKLLSATYRFLDKDGSTLALRADMNIPVA